MRLEFLHVGWIRNNNCRAQTIGIGLMVQLTKADYCP